MTVFLVILIAGDPGLINRERRWLRVATGLMIALIAVSNVFSALRLIDGIIRNDSFATEPVPLLQIGGIVWATNVIAFALWYWDVDGGGSVRRAIHGPWNDPAFVFPEMQMPERVPADWYPHFADYFAFSFATATAFSPTDVSAIKRWAKMLMIAESAASLALATLVLAKAINGLGS
jgi:cytochrome c biogenesis protein CcdA